jgi:hypothetical protein
VSVQRWSFVALLAMSCTFDDVRPAVVDGGSNQADADAACVDACDGDTLVRCDGTGPVRTECAAGCTGGPEPRCAAMVPANDVGLDDLVEVPAIGFVVPAGRTYTIKTDLGLITDEAGGVIRPATPGGGLHLETASVYQPRGDALALFAVDSLTVEAGAVMRGEGTRALVVLSRRDITVAGTFDFSAGCQDQRGPVCGGAGGGTGGVNDPATDAQGCAPGGNGRGSPSAEAAGAETGGGGGGLGGSGAAGGDAVWSPERHPGGRPGEVSDACPNASLVPLRGGSGGGAGGRGDVNGGLGGGGGGAMQLSSLTRIVVGSGGAEMQALLLANGAGGSAPAMGRQGGGGGGSGGAILLEAPDVNIAAGSVVAANGGGGGSGEGPSTDPGLNGAPGGSTAARALGGRGNDDGAGYGGQGGARSGFATAGGEWFDGSGGGGGGVGILRINARTLSIAADAVISPAHTQGEIAIE